MKFNLTKKELAQAQADLVALRLMPDKILVTPYRLGSIRRWVGICGGNQEEKFEIERTGIGYGCMVCRCRVDFGNPRAHVNADAHQQNGDIIIAFARALRGAKEIIDNAVSKGKFKGRCL